MNLSNDHPSKHMSTWKVYAYTGCGTCRSALKFLQNRNIPHTVLPIREQPPSLAELTLVLGLMKGNLRKLFNTSGQDYQSMGLAAKLPGMRTEEALKLLASNGRLVKRPFVVGNGTGTVGFDEAGWSQLFSVSERSRPPEAMKQPAPPPAASEKAKETAQAKPASRRGSTPAPRVSTPSKTRPSREPR